MTKHAGDAKRQAEIVQQICRQLDGKPIIDVIGAVETIMANSVCDRSSSYEVAIEGLTACFEDMKAVVQQRFNKKADDA